MPLDTSIPLSFQPPQLPDFNALAQQSGANVMNMMNMQNSIADRQAAQSAAETAAMEKALTPALAAAFTDPSDEGLAAAFDLVPDQYKDAAQSQLAELQAIRDPAMRKNVLRSGLAQYDFGKVILQQLEPTANMVLQAKTAERRAALDEQRFALDERRIGIDEAKLNRPETMTPYQQAQIDLEKAKLEETKTKETAEEVKKRLSEEKRDKDIAFAVKEVEAAAAKGGLLDDATSSYFGNAVDAALQTFGIGTPGAIANAKMKPIADLVLKLVPRFEGPQSDKDTQSYKDAAGDLANPNVPASVKKAAATQIVGLLKKYSGQFEYTGGEDTGGGEDVDTNNPLLSDGE